MTTKQTPRGLRNNNPLNIRRNNIQWQGLADEQTDREFCVFRSLEYGIRAAFVILRTYITKYRLTSVALIIGRWAPPTENNTAQYVNVVLERSGIQSNERLDFKKKNQMCRLLWAMAYVECGQMISFGRIENAYAMI